MTRLPVAKYVLHGLFFSVFLCLVFSPAGAWDPNKPFIYEMRIAFETDNWVNAYSTSTVLSKSENTVAFRVVANSTTSPAYQLVVTTQGNVGISTGNPQARLEVRGSPSSAYSLAVGTGSAYQFVVSTGGNVGVGSADPSQKLDVSGDMRAHGMNFEYLGHFSFADANGEFTFTDHGGAGLVLVKWENGGWSNDGSELYLYHCSSVNAGIMEVAEHYSGNDSRIDAAVKEYGTSGNGYTTTFRIYPTGPWYGADYWVYRIRLAHDYP